MHARIVCFGVAVPLAFALFACVLTAGGTPGTKRWEFVTGSAVYSCPAIGADGTVYLGSGKKLYAFQGTTPLAESPWPKFGGNAQKTGGVQTTPSHAQPPTIAVPPQGLTNAAGSTATFNVGTSGSPPLGYQWWKSYARLVEGDRLAGTRSASLTILPLSLLVGVFLAGSPPNLTPAPATVSFEPNGLTYMAGLEQVFLTGDGRTGQGAVQRFTVPSGATRLLLGTMDGCEWSNNTGSFTVQVLSQAADPVAPADPIVNGSFEVPVVSRYEVFLSIPGWTTTFGPGIEVHHDISLVGSPFHGDQLVDLASYADSGMVQQVPTVPGQAYQLVFAYSPRPGIRTYSNGIDVLFDSARVASIARDGTGLSNTLWSNFTFTVVASGRVTPLEFRAMGANTGFGGLLDYVRLTVIPGPPEIRAQPIGARVPLGTGFDLAVIAGGDCPMTYQWYQGGLPLTNATNRTFAVTKAQLAYAGNYQVVVTNSLGSVTSQVAQLVVGYSLNLETIGLGTIVASPLATVYEPGSTVELTATPAAERAFLGWKGDAAGLTNPLRLTMDAHRRVVAEFSLRPGDVIWEYPTDWGISCSPALGTDGTVYFGTAMTCNCCAFYALDGATGQKRWDLTMIGSVFSSSTVGADGSVYVPSGGKLYALHEATGARLWELDANDLSYDAAIGTDSTVYVTAGRNLYALDSTTGMKRWVIHLGGYGALTSPAIGADGTLYVVPGGGKVHALNGATGLERWEFPTGGGIWSPPAIGADGTIYVGSDEGKVYALDGATGTNRWEFLTGGRVSSSAAVGPDGTVYVGSYDKRVYALDGATGVKKWDFTTGGGEQSSPAIAADGTLYVGSMRPGTRVYALDAATGAQLWAFQTESGVGSSPTIGRDGTVYLGSGNRLYALKGTAPLADSPWPKFRGNAQNTGQLRLAPRIGRGLYSRVFLEGTEHTVTVPILGAPTPSVQWHFNGQPIFAATNATWRIASVEATHEGVYTVVASNALGQVTSQPMILLVNNVAPERILGLTLHASAGTALEVQSADTLGSPVPWAAWTNLVLPTRPYTVLVSAPTKATGFYRSTDTNWLDLALLPAWLYRQAVGSQHRIEYVEGYTGWTNWSLLMNLTLPSSPYLFIDYSATNRLPRYYRTTPLP